MMISPSDNNWFAYRKSNRSAGLRLFCFPYAGGSAITYRSWSDLLPQNIEVCPIELPGRGSRLREKPYQNIVALVHDLGSALRPHLDKPYVCFGHSMGALIEFELARFFRRQKFSQPLLLFASGHTAPQAGCSHDPIYNLPDDQFKKELCKLDGTPEAVINNDELMELLLPMLRADFQMNETYAYKPEPPLAVPIVAYGGCEDSDVDRASLQAWQEQTTARFSLHMFEGGHFFLQTAQTKLLQTLAYELQKLI